LRINSQSNFQNLPIFGGIPQLLKNGGFKPAYGMGKGKNVAVQLPGIDYGLFSVWNSIQDIALIYSGLSITLL